MDQTKTYNGKIEHLRGAEIFQIRRNFHCSAASTEAKRIASKTPMVVKLPVLFTHSSSSVIVEQFVHRTYYMSLSNADYPKMWDAFKFLKLQTK